MKIIDTPNAPKAVGPYVQGIEMNGFLFASGQIGFDPTTMQIPGKTSAEQATQILKNLRAVVAASNSSWDRIVKVTIFLTNMGDFDAVNKIYAEAFSSHKPARSTVEVSKLPKGALVEMELIAALK